MQKEILIMKNVETLGCRYISRYLAYWIEKEPPNNWWNGANLEAQKELGQVATPPENGQQRRSEAVKKDNLEGGRARALSLEFGQALSEFR